MIIALYCVAAAMVLGGVYSVFAGWEIVILERGWTQVLSGVIVATGGVMLAAIAFLASEFRKVDASLRAQTSNGLAVTPSAETAFAQRDFTRPHPIADASTDTALTGAAALALAGFEKAKGTFADKTEHNDSARTSPVSDLQASQKKPMADTDKPQEPEPEPQPSLDEDFLTRATQPQASDDARREPEAHDATPPLSSPSSTENDSGVDGAPNEPARDAPENEDGLRNAVADALFAEDVSPAPDAPEPAGTAAAISGHAAVEPELSEASALNLPDEDEVERPALSGEAALMHDEQAGQKLEADPSVLRDRAVNEEQERFATLLEGQTATEDREDAASQPETGTIPEQQPLSELSRPETNAPEPGPIPDTVEAERERAPEAAPISAAAPSAEVAAEVSAPAPELSVIGTYESGGNTYTMYADGSIDAKTPEGDYHFISLDELKIFIAEGGENRGP